MILVQTALWPTYLWSIQKRQPSQSLLGSSNLLGDLFSWRRMGCSQESKLNPAESDAAPIRILPKIPPSCLTTVEGHEPSVICPNWIATWAQTAKLQTPGRNLAKSIHDCLIWSIHKSAKMVSLNQGLLNHMMGPWSKRVLPKDTGDSNKISTQVQYECIWNSATRRMAILIGEIAVNDWLLGYPIFRQSQIDYLPFPHRGFHKWGYPNSWMVYFMENPI